MKRSGPIKRKKYLPRSTKPIKTRRVSRRFAKHRCEPFTDWLKASWTCLICQRSPVDPAHLKTRGSGGDDLNNVVPLCRFHHDQQEGHTAAFQQKYGTNLDWHARWYTDRWLMTPDGQAWRASHPELAEGRTE